MVRCEVGSLGSEMTVVGVYPSWLKSPLIAACDAMVRPAPMDGTLMSSGMSLAIAQMGAHGGVKGWKQSTMLLLVRPF